MLSDLNPNRDAAPARLWQKLRLISQFSFSDLRKLRRVRRYFSDMRKFEAAGGAVTQYFPILNDYEKQAGTAKGHYFHQDLLVATLINKANPERHIDIGSSIDGFVAHVAAFRTIEVLDIRALDDCGHERIKFMQANFMLPLDKEMCAITDSLSCLHALEHFGLGRYGDPIDPTGHLKGFANLHKMLKPGGTLYISFPIGTSAIYFNAHRVFDPGEIMKWSEDLFRLERFDYVDDGGDLHQRQSLESVPRMNYGCGIYTMTKLAASQKQSDAHISANTKEPITPSLGANGSGKKRQYLLGIAIPTYNRGARLSRSLNELREIIAERDLRDSVSVYVTDNGSTDNTREILAGQSREFEQAGINFIYESVEANKGFDSNVKRCFTRGVGDYCWFVSDDDNLEKDVLEKILKDIRAYQPNVMICNFDQAPYGKSSPLIREKKFVMESGTDFGFGELIRFTKFTSLIVRRIDDPLQSEVFNNDEVLSSGFSFTALAMQTAYRFGRILLSSDFCATHDANHRDHIDFPPYIGNRLNSMCRMLLDSMGKPEWAKLYGIPHTDVGVSSLEWLIDHYRGRAVVPRELRRELRRGLAEYVAERKYRLLLHPKFIRRCFYFAIAWARFIILEKGFGMSVVKHRTINR